MVRKEAVLITSVPESLSREPLIMEFMDNNRHFVKKSVYIHKGDLIYELSYRFRKVLYSRGIAVPIILDVEYIEPQHKEPDKELERHKKPKNTNIEREQQTKTKKKKPAQTTIFSFLKKD